MPPSGSATAACWSAGGAEQSSCGEKSWARGEMSRAQTHQAARARGAVPRPVPGAPRCQPNGFTPWFVAGLESMSGFTWTKKNGSGFCNSRIEKKKKRKERLDKAVCSLPWVPGGYLAARTGCAPRDDGQRSFHVRAHRCPAAFAHTHLCPCSLCARKHPCPCTRGCFSRAHMHTRAGAWLCTRVCAHTGWERRV